MIHITIDCEEWNSPYLRGKKDLDNFPIDVVIILIY